WFERSKLHYTCSLVSLWLVEGQLELGRQSEAVAVLETVLETAIKNGYHHLEGVAERLLGEALGTDAAASAHLERATRVLEKVGAQNDLGKVLVAEAAVLAAGGDVPAARDALDRAQEIFTSLGTLDGPRRVAALRASLEAMRDADTITSEPS